MKSITHILITHAVFLLLFGGAALALAQEESTTESDELPAVPSTSAPETSSADVPLSPPETEDRVQKQRINPEMEPEQLRERQSERRVQLKLRAQERIINLAANLSNRLEAAIFRLQNIVDRMASRMEKLQEMDVDTSEAETALASAQLSIEAATTALSDIDESVLTAVGSEDIRSAWTKVKETYQTVRNHLKTAQSELRASVAALKEAVAAADTSTGVADAVRNNPRPDLDLTNSEEN